MNTFKVIRKFSTQKFPGRSVVIVSAKRTPIGTFLGKLSKVKGTDLGAAAINGCLDASGLSGDKIRGMIDEVILGNVVSAGLGQAPARQASIGAKIPVTVPCTTVNKVCASGMKTVMLGAQSIALGLNNTVVAGGFESMSNVPFYVTNHRSGFSFGNQQLIDGLAFDGLTDVYNNIAMGLCAEKTASDFKIDRATQDEFCFASYERALQSQKDKLYASEIVPFKINDKETLEVDEEPLKYKKDKIPGLRPAFSKTGTITAANASKLNDGGAAMLLMSEEQALKLGLKPLGRIIGYADAEIEPIDFCIAPAKACQIALNRAGKKINDVDYHEINEAFAVTALANMKLMDIDHSKINVHGGAVAMGHPIGMSGCRIIMSVLNVLRQKKGKIGMASICNGGGGASAVIVENLQ
jgi:acetyl-CoA C-acetyltransferase